MSRLRMVYDPCAGPSRVSSIRQSARMRVQVSQLQNHVFHRWGVATRWTAAGVTDRDKVACRAAANNWGFPASQSGLQRALQRAGSFVSKQSLPIGLFVAVLMGYLFPQPAVAMSKANLTRVSTFLIFLISGAHY
jgi:hypothetical protein